MPAKAHANSAGLLSWKCELAMLTSSSVKGHQNSSSGSLAMWLMMRFVACMSRQGVYKFINAVPAVTPFRADASMMLRKTASPPLGGHVKGPRVRLRVIIDIASGYGPGS